MQKIFDAHFHILSPNFPLTENNGFLPDYYSVEDYQNEVKQLGLDVVGGAVTSASYQGEDQTFFSDALTKLGKNFIGITQLPFDTTNEQLHELNDRGIRGIRYNLYRGFSYDLKELERFSFKVYEQCRWKTEFYVNAQLINKELKQIILKLPKASIDHFGMKKVPIDYLKEFVASGVPIRTTGFGRVEYSRDEVSGLLENLYKENSEGLIFGTDLPSTRAKYRFSKDDVQLIIQTLGETKANKVLYENGIKWYLTT